MTQKNQSLQPFLDQIPTGYLPDTVDLVIAPKYPL
jgi:hypothetical protein